MRSTKWIALAAVALASEWLIAAEPATYVGWESREIKALSAEQMKAYADGDGMGLALAAELNRYPGPKHVLELRQELELSREQLAETEAVFGEMQEEARLLGREILEREQELDRLFAEWRIGEESLESSITEIAKLGGELRFAHLRAHLATAQILTEHQIERYVEYRGYGAGEHHMGDHPAAEHDNL